MAPAPKTRSLYWPGQIGVCAALVGVGLLGSVAVPVLGWDGRWLVAFLVLLVVGAVSLGLILPWYLRMTPEQRKVHAWATMQHHVYPWEEGGSWRGASAMSRSRRSRELAAKARDGMLEPEEFRTLRLLRPDYPYPAPVPPRYIEPPSP